MHDLDVRSYKDLKDQDKLIESLCYDGNINLIDYHLLQACSNVYKPQDKQDNNPQSAIIRILLQKFNQKPIKVIEFLDIDGNGNISRQEFIEGSMKMAYRFDRVTAV